MPGWGNAWGPVPDGAPDLWSPRPLDTGLEGAFAMAAISGRPGSGNGRNPTAAPEGQPRRGTLGKAGFAPCDGWFASVTMRR